MSVLIKRLVPRFTFVGLFLVAVGAGIYVSDLGQEGTAQSDPNGGTTLLQSLDIGHVGSPGAYVTLDGEHMISSYGSDIWDTRDGFQFAYQPWRGDGEFIALVREMSNSHPRARAGIMVRSSLDSDAANAFVTATPNHGVHFLRRRETAGLTWDDAHTNLGMTSLEDRALYQRRFSDLHPHDKSTVNQVSLPRWFRLVRSGDTFHVYDSADGVQWEWIGTDTIPMRQDVYVGLAVSSRNPKVECVAEFSDLSFSSLSAQTLANQLLVEPKLGKGDGLRGRYFEDRSFENEVLSRVDPQLEFIWWQEGPAEGMPTDQFSVRWEGLLEAQYSEPYLLHLVADEQASLWLDGRLLIDDWFEHRATETAALVNLEAGKQYHIRIDYTEARSHAMVRLEWSSPSTAKETIPQSQLYSQLADTDNDQVPDAWERAFAIEPGQAVPNDLRLTIESAESSFAALHKTSVRSVATLLIGSYSDGKHPGALAGRTKSVDQAPDWISLDLSAAGPDGRAQGVNEAARQRLTATSARYGQVDGRFPSVTRDKFHFSYRPKRGDHELIARIADIESQPSLTLAGVMVRASTDPTSPFVAVMVSPSRESWVLCREQAGHGARMQRLGLQAQWVKLERRGDQVSLYESTDGETWRWLGHEPFVPQVEVCYGIAAQGAGMAAQATVELDDISLKPLPSSGRKIPPFIGTGLGLNATYSDTTQSIAKVEGPIDYYWPDGTSPTSGLTDDYFTVNWEGELQAQYSEIYTLELACDDGARLWLDGLLLIDDWRDSSAYPRSIKIELEGGRRYPIRLEYYEAAQDASASLRWSSPSTVRQVIPQSQLYSQMGAETFGFVGRGSGPRLPRVGDSDEIYRDQNEGPLGPPAPNGTDTVLQVVKTLDPSSFADSLGNWEVDEEGVVCTSRRGRIDYEFQVSQAAMYLLEIAGEAAWPHPDPNYLLWIDVDGHHLSRRLLTGGDAKIGRQLTPWLEAGTHHLSIYWDNTLPGRALRLSGIELQRLDGPDRNENQVSDWMETELARSNGVDSSLESFVSPATVEGRALYWKFIDAQVSGKPIPVVPGAGERWSLALPLDPEQATQVDLGFENNGLLQSHQVTWKPTNLATTGPLIVRQGDSLLFTMDSGRSDRSTAAVAVEGNHYQIAQGETVVHQFNQPGQFAMQVFMGRGQPRIVLVTVVAPVAVEAIAAIAGHWREWTSPELADSVQFESDPLVELNQLASPDGATRYRLRSFDPVTRYINLRLGVGGPILQQILVEGFRLDHGNHMGPARVAETFDDGSRNVEVDLIMMPIRSTVRVEGKVLAGGVLHATGSLRERYPARAFNPLGILTQTFFLPSTSKTSICHEINTFQGTRKINEF